MGDAAGQNYILDTQTRLFARLDNRTSAAIAEARPITGLAFSPDGRFFLSGSTEPFFAICHANSPLAANASLDLQDLPDDEIILMDEGHCLRGQALDACRVRLVGSQDRHPASVETLRHLVAAGSGHSLILALAVNRDPLLERTVRYIPLGNPHVGRTIALAWRATDPRAQSYRALSVFMAGIRLPGIVRLTGS